MRAAPRPYTSPEETLVGIDVAHTVQQLLVQQSCFNRGFALAEKLDEVFQFNLQRLRTRPGKAFLAHFQPAKAPGVYKPQLSSGREFRNQVSVLLDLGFRSCDQHASRHAKMHDPLAGACGAIRFQIKWLQIENNVLPYPADTGKQ